MEHINVVELQCFVFEFFFFVLNPYLEKNKLNSLNNLNQFWYFFLRKFLLTLIWSRVRQLLDELSCRKELGKFIKAR